MKICIIGAGPTGLGAAYRLAELGFSDFRVFDKQAYAGGMSTTLVDTAGFAWDLGVHVMHSHYAYVDRLLDTVLPEGYCQHNRRSWIRHLDRYIPYPFQYNIRHLPREAAWDCIAGLLAAAQRREDGPPRNFEEWIIAMFGEGIARHFMLPYNRKQWCVDLKQMAYQWIGERVPPPDLTRILENVILEKDESSWGPNHKFRFPKKGGTGAIWNALAGKLPPQALCLSREVKGVDPAKKRLLLADGTTESYDALISTIPLPELLRISGLADSASAARGLAHTQVQVLGVALRCRMPDALKDKTWIYHPDEGSPFYRLTPFSTFSSDLVANPERDCSVLCETSCLPDRALDLQELRESTLRELGKAGFPEASLERAHTFQITLPYAYPVPTLQRDRILEATLPPLESLGIYSRGRFGAWKYEAGNMDHCIMQGVEAVDRILSGTPEKTVACRGSG